MNRKRVQIRIFSSVISIVLIVLSTSFQADDSVARNIMQKVDDRDDGDNRVSDMEMVLTDKNGNKRVRQLRQFSKDKGEDTLSLIFFMQPADVKDTGFLTWDYDVADKDDDQWLYLPALGKTKRIAASDKSSRFMGSDFNYSDMTSRQLEDFEFRLMKEDEVRGHAVWVIEVLPLNQEVIDETGYSKSIVFVRKDNYFVVRGLSWVADSDDIKYLDIRSLEKIDGVWVATDITMTTRKGKEMHHKTRLKMSNVLFNQPLETSFFTVRQLEKGP